MWDWSENYNFTTLWDAKIGDFGHNRGHCHVTYIAMYSYFHYLLEKIEHRILVLYFIFQIKEHRE